MIVVNTFLGNLVDFLGSTKTEFAKKFESTASAKRGTWFPSIKLSSKSILVIC